MTYQLVPCMFYSRCRTYGVAGVTDEHLSMVSRRERIDSDAIASEGKGRAQRS